MSLVTNSLRKMLLVGHMRTGTGYVSHVEGSGGQQPAIMTHLADEGAEIGLNHC